MTVRTRFAPSPTGYLHIGGARTALFNYLFAKKHGGDFLLRVEDTDQKRSTKEAKEAIIESLTWLDLMPDEDIIYQSQNIERHKEIAKELLASGNAYYCYTPQEEINALREEKKAKGEHFIFESKYRDGLAGADIPEGAKPVIRLKTPKDGATIIDDMLQGSVKVENSHLDDMVILRSDGTPTYMLAAVVDDHDMGITHIIRGDDHLNNAFKQKIIYDAMGWQMPQMAHVPLIYGPDGAKLSKRHGAVGAEKYRELGYLPDALNNYLLRLGWSHGDDEIISRSLAIEWFGIEGMGKSPSRIDFDKMKNVNAQYLRSMENKDLLELIISEIKYDIKEDDEQNILQGIDCMKPRAELITQMVDMASMFICRIDIKYTEDALEIIKDTPQGLMNEVVGGLDTLPEWDKEAIQALLKELAAKHELKLGALMKYIRPRITGTTASPSVFDIIAIIGLGETKRRLESA